MSALGRHILEEYQGCSSEILNDVLTIEQSMVKAAEEAGATVINATFHHFSPYGVSGVVVIQESHLAIHTWPEFQYAAVDIFTCGETVNPWISYDVLMNAFQAAHGNAMEISRGSTDLLRRVDFDIKKNENEVKAKIKNSPPTYKREVWLSNKNKDIALSFRHAGALLFRQKSPFQTVEVYETYAFGKMLTLDHQVSCTEQDEFIYHEMIAHVPMQSHFTAKNILVIGGGDGGTVRELLKYERVEKITLVEIDEVVLEAARQFLPSISKDLNHPKLEIIIEDGIAFLAKSKAKMYDLIIIDSSDPNGTAKGLFTNEFYENCYRSLKFDGVLCLQSEGPFFNAEVFVAINKCLKEIFSKEMVFTYLTYIPTYPTGMWSFTYASKNSIHPLEFDKNAATHFANEQELKFYNGEIHHAAFALPNFVRQMLDNVSTMIELVND